MLSPRYNELSVINGSTVKMQPGSQALLGCYSVECRLCTMYKYEVCLFGLLYNPGDTDTFKTIKTKKDGK